MLLPVLAAGSLIFDLLFVKQLFFSQIATSVAARGLDVKELILVVNYDCPNHYEDYVHRCGRTGRAGNRGHAFTFIGEIRTDIESAISTARTGTLCYTQKQSASKFVDAHIS